jgi:hypothetical protein
MVGKRKKSLFFEGKAIAKVTAPFNWPSLQLATDFISIVAGL